VNLVHEASCLFECERIGALFWLSNGLEAVSLLPELGLVVFFVSHKAVTRPGIDDSSLVICVGVQFVTRVDKVGILLDLKIFRAISRFISRVGGLLSRATKHLNACSCFFYQLFLYFSWREVSDTTWLFLYP